ncbi:hypothetical protein YB2330_003756 [Saitoella coloradoensis]
MPNSTVLSEFAARLKSSDLENGDGTVVLAGNSLSPGVLYDVAHLGVRVSLSPHTKALVDNCAQWLEEQLAKGEVIYGVNTGFGGSADTRTKDTWGLQASLIRHLNVGAMEGGKLDAADVRATMCIRVSSALHGASAVRWSTIQVMETMLNAGVTPVIPLRGSISASGDLIPLSYIAAALTGRNGSLCAVRGKSEPVPSSDALAALNAGPLTLSPKEGLAIVNGTSVGAAVASNVTVEVDNLLAAATIASALVMEAVGSESAGEPPATVCENKDIEAVFKVLLLSPDTWRELRKEITGGSPRNGREKVSLATVSSFLTAAMHHLNTAMATLTIELNSVTDNPLFHPQSNTTLHGGNFQAMAVTRAVSSLITTLVLLAELLYALHASMVNHDISGLAPNLAWGDPSRDFGMKGVDIAMCALLSEVQSIASGDVSSHIRSAELDNQSVNSMALVAARKAREMTKLVKIMVGYVLLEACQALDLAEKRKLFLAEASDFVVDRASRCFETSPAVSAQLEKTFILQYEATKTMDVRMRMDHIAASLVPHLIQTSSNAGHIHELLRGTWKKNTAATLEHMWSLLKRSEAKGSIPLSPLLARIYSHIRDDLEVDTHEFGHSEIPHGAVVDIIVRELAPKHGRLAVEIAEVIAAAVSAAPSYTNGSTNGHTPSGHLASPDVSAHDKIAAFSADLLKISQISTALTAEALLGTIESYDPKVHALRPHPGQIRVGANLTGLLKGSRLIHQHTPDADLNLGDRGLSGPRELKQDRYALRTAPQWIGPQMEALEIAVGILSDPDASDIARICALDSVRACLQALCRLAMAQLTEIMTDSMNKGLPHSPDVDISVQRQAEGTMAKLELLSAPLLSHMQNGEINKLDTLVQQSIRTTAETLAAVKEIFAAHMYACVRAIEQRVMLEEKITHVQTAVETRFGELLPGFTHQASGTIRQILQASSRYDESMLVNALSSLLLLHVDISIPDEEPPTFDISRESLQVQSRLSELKSVMSDAMPTFKSEADAGEYIGDATGEIFVCLRGLCQESGGLEGLKNVREFLEGEYLRRVLEACLP